MIYSVKDSGELVHPSQKESLQNVQSAQESYPYANTNADDAHPSVYGSKEYNLVYAVDDRYLPDVKWNKKKIQW